MRRGLIVSALALCVFGCGKGQEAKSEKKGEELAGVRAKFVLSAEPEGAAGVKAAREKAGDGKELVVTGRIGGSKKPFTGRASFTIVDDALTPCNERPGDDCPTPWDYCCDAPEDLAQGTVLLKLTDEEGRTLAHDARELLGVKELSRVVVRGLAQCDAKGNLTSIRVQGIFVKE